MYIHNGEQYNRSGIPAVFLHAVKKLSGVFEEWVSSRFWPQCKPCLRAAAVLLSGRIHLSQTNGGVRLSLFIYPSSPESSIFQLAAGKRLWREVCDPDDSGGTTTNCGTEKWIWKIQRVWKVLDPGPLWLNLQYVTHTHAHMHSCT